MPSNLLDALSQMVDNYPGGRPVVALRLNKADETLRKELAGAVGYKMGLLTAHRIQTLCDELKTEDCGRMLALMAGEVGARVEAITPHCAPGPDFATCLSSVVSASSRSLVVGIESLSDGVLTDNELTNFERSLDDQMTDIQLARVAARAANARCKPAFLREVA